MSEPTIRRAQKPDLPAVLGLYAELNNGRVATLDQAEASLARLASYPDYGLYVAEVDGRIVGTFCLVILDNIAHWGMPSALVESVVVSAAERGTGLGRRMMREAGRLAGEKGCYKLALSSNVDAKPAHRFYESLGFERYGYSFRLDPPFTTDNGPSADGEAVGSLSPPAAGLSGEPTRRGSSPPPSAGEGARRSRAGEGQRDAAPSGTLHEARDFSGSGVPSPGSLRSPPSPAEGGGENLRLSLFPNSLVIDTETTA